MMDSGVRPGDLEELGPVFWDVLLFWGCFLTTETTFLSFGFWAASCGAPSHGWDRVPWPVVTVLEPDVVTFAGDWKDGEGLGLRCRFVLGGFGPLDIQLYQHSLLKSLFSSLNCLCAFLNWQIRRSVCPLILLSTLIPMSNCFDYRIFTSLEGGRCTSDNSSFSTLFLLLFNCIFNCISTCYYKFL